MQATALLPLTVVSEEPANLQSEPCRQFFCNAAQVFRKETGERLELNSPWTRRSFGEGGQMGGHERPKQKEVKL